MCNPLDLGGCISEAADDAIKSFANSVASAVGKIVQDMMTWWLHTPSFFLTGTATAVQNKLEPIVAVLAVAAMVWTGVRMIWQRRGDPLFHLVPALLRLVAVSSLGILVVSQALALSDSLSTWLLNAATQNQAAQGVTGMLTLSTTAFDPALVILLGIVILIMAVVQWVVLMFRQAALVVLVPMLPLAAATSLSPRAMGWRRIAAWVLSLLCYKPMCALIYYIGFESLGAETGLVGVITGLIILGLAVIALPAMLRFFSWGIDHTASGLTDGGWTLGAVGAVASVATTAVGMATFMRMHGPGGASGGDIAPRSRTADNSAPAAATLPALARGVQRLALPAGPSGGAPSVESA